MPVRPSLAALAPIAPIAPIAFAALMPLPASARPDASPLLKGPYLQALGQTGVTIKLERRTLTPVSIEITGPDGFLRVIDAPPPPEPAAATAATTAKPAAATSRPLAKDLFLSVRVDGLRPGTTYRYVVMAGGAPTEPGRFTTAPPDSRPFRFIVYGDNRSDHVAHAAVVRAIEAVPSDFLLHTGDMVAKGNSPADWQAFFDVERSLLRDRCAFASVGNHELTAPDPSGEVAFLRYFGGADLACAGESGACPGAAEPRAGQALYGSFRWSNTRFFLLNAMDAWTGDELRWLREELERASNEPGLVHRIAALHHGPFSSGPHGGNKRLADAGVIRLLRDHRVDLLFAGHDHAYERGEGEGLRYIVSGGGGAPLYKRKNGARETQVFESVHHFVEVAIDGEAVETTARRASGGVIERCSFKGGGPWVCGQAKEGTGVNAVANGASLPSPAMSSSCRCEVVGRPSPSMPWAALVAALGAVLRRVSAVGEGRAERSGSRDA